MLHYQIDLIAYINPKFYVSVLKIFIIISALLDGKQAYIYILCSLIFYNSSDLLQTPTFLLPVFELQQVMTILMLPD